MTTHRSHPVDTFSRDGLTFDVVDAGPADGTPVVLLHGWPSGAACWDGVARHLADRGIRTLAPDQRGYSPRARPPGTRDYALPELVADVLALLDAAGLDAAHVVGHDWGGAVAWVLASTAPERVTSLTVLSTPHPAAMARALRSSDQALRSAYIAVFQIPVLPERLLLARNGAVLRALLEHSGLPREVAARYVECQLEPGALTAALKWYRAIRSSRPGSGSGPAGTIEVPTLYMWSDRDAALGPRAAELTAEHVSGPYRFEVVHDASHWLPEQHADLVAELVAEQVDAHPAGPSR